MAEDTTIGLKIVAETDSFDMAIKKTKDNIKQLGANFKESVAGLDKWSQSSDGLVKKIDSLNGEMGQYKTQAELLKKKIAELSKNEQANAKAIENKKKELQQVNTKYKETQQAVKHYTDQLDSVKQSEDQAKSASGQLAQKISEQKAKVEELQRAYKDSVLTYGENSKQSKNLAKELQSASKALDNIEDEARQADEALSKLSDNTDKTSKHLGSIEAVGKRASSSLKKIGLGATALITGFLHTASSTRELRTNMAKLDTAFTTNNHTAKQAEKTYKDLYGVLGDTDQATETANLIASMAKNEKDLNKWTEISTGVFATFGDSLPVESLAEASQETVKTGEVVGTLADALNWAGISQEDFQKKLDGCSNEQERQALITDTLSKKYGKASKQYKETNKDIIASNKAQADLSEQMAEVGKVAEPLMTQIKEMGASLLEHIVPFIQDWMPKIQKNLPAIAGGIALVVGGLTGLAVATTVAKVAMDAYTVVTKTWTAITKIASGVQLAFNAIMSANPVGLVILGITALIAVFVLLWKKCEGFREFWINLWDKIKSATSAFINWFKSIPEKIKNAFGNIDKWMTEKFGSAWEGIKSYWSTVVDYFKMIWESIKTIFSVVKKVLSGDFKGAWDSIKALAGKWADFFKGVWNKIKNVFSPVTSWLSDKFKKAWDGIKKAWSNTKSFFKEKYNDVTSSFSNIGSKIGSYFKNAWNGAKLAWKDPKKFFSNVADNVTNAFNKIPAPIREKFSKAWSKVTEVWNNSKVGQFFNKIGESIVKAFDADSLFDVGKNLVKGLWNGINNMTDWVIKKIKGFSGNVLKGIKNFFHIESPSKVMRDQVGVNIAKGIGVGISKETKSVTKTMTTLGKSVLKEAKKSNGDYSAVGKKAIQNYTDGLNAKANDSIQAVKNLIDKQASNMKGYSKSAQEEFKKAGKATLSAYTDSIKSGTEKAIASVGSSITKITDSMQSKYDEVADKQKAMQDRLRGTGKLFTIDSETGKVTLNNLKDETAQINKFAGNLTALKKKLPTGLISELVGLDTEEGLNVTDAIKKLSKKELDAYVASYNAREKASKKASEQYYANEVKTIKTQFNDKVSSALKTLPNKLNNIGVNTMNGFTKGMNSQTKGMSKSIKAISNDIIKQFKTSLKIHSPSKETEQDGEYLVEGLSEGVENAEGGFFNKLGSFIGGVKNFFGNIFKDGFNLKDIFSNLFDESKGFLEGIAKKLGLDFGIDFSEGVTESTEDVGEAIVESVNEPSLGQKLKSGLDKLSKYFNDWQKKTGAYIAQIQGYFDNITGYVMDLADSIGGYFSTVTDNAISEIERQVEALQEATEKEIEVRENQTNAEIANLEMQKEAGVLTDEQYAQKKQEIEQQLADFSAQKKDDEAKQEKELLKKKDELGRKQFEANKRNSIAQALVNTASAIMKAFAELGWIGGAIASAMLTATSVAQIASINAQKYVPALAKGGVADGATLAMIGENGKEAVIPLEKNTGWMNEFAEKLSAIMQKDFLSNVKAEPLVSTLDGRTGSTVNNFTQVINAPKTPSRRELYRDTKNLLALKGV